MLPGWKFSDQRVMVDYVHFLIHDMNEAAASRSKAATTREFDESLKTDSFDKIWYVVDSFWRTHQWLDSDLIPKLLEKFEKWKNFMVILFSLENNPYRRIFSA